MDLFGDLTPPETHVAPAVLTVAALTDHIKELLEGSFPSVWVSGEISNLSQPQSGHCYLTLKDEQAQIRAVIWRSVVARVRFALEDGLAVICQGDLEVYGPRGTYQLVIRQIQPQGIGALELALRRLRERLAAEGLFDMERKRPLPAMPRRIAFVTSPTGAAIRDFLEVLRRRWQGADVLVVPVRVQGEGAAQEIAAAIAAVNRLREPVDCLVVGRGGGSLEDLWAFNEEVVVRAIHASRIPVVSAVGHEIDVTLADLVADVRALTPSEAAELVVPASDELKGALRVQQQRLVTALRGRASAARVRLDHLAGQRGFRRPLERVHALAQQLDELSARGQRALQYRVRAARQRTTSLAANLEALSPLAVLGRGYSITHRAADGGLVRDASNLSVGELLTTRLAHGTISSLITAVSADPADAGHSPPSAQPAPTEQPE